jgi:predicted enzyme related to lactoylglutathione lyase
MRKLIALAIRYATGKSRIAAPLCTSKDAFHRVSCGTLIHTIKWKEFFMTKGVRSIIYPVKDMARAKTLFRTLLGVEPYSDQPYYVGFRVGDQDIGLDPNGHKAGMTVYYHVDDIKQSLQSLLEAGSQILQEIKDVGGGGLIASVRDADGNIVGLIQQP